MNKLTSTFALGLALTIGAAAFAPAANAATATAPAKPSVIRTEAAPTTIIGYAKAIIKLQTEREASTKGFNDALAAEKPVKAALDVAAEKATADQKAKNVANLAALDKAIAERKAAPKAKLDKTLAAEKAAQAARLIERDNAYAKNEQTRANSKAAYDAGQREVMAAWQSGVPLDIARQTKLNTDFGTALRNYEARIVAIRTGFANDTIASETMITAIYATYRTSTQNTDADVAKLRAAFEADRKVTEARFQETVFGPLSVKREASRAKIAALEGDYRKTTSEYWANLNTLKAGLSAAKI